MRFALMILMPLACLACACGLAPGLLTAGEAEVESAAGRRPEWHQWRGPRRDGQVEGPQWPDRLDPENIERVWRVKLGESYSGPIVTDDLIFTTETRDKKIEAAVAIDRRTGNEVWRKEWDGAISVPFFATRNGNWIRSTPAYDGECLYVAGMRDVLVCLDGTTGNERWRVDFVKEFNTTIPAFGFVCSPLIDGDGVFVQAGCSLAKVDRQTGKVIWRSLQDAGGMMGSAFSSPVIAELCGKRHIVVQTREKLAGVDIDSGNVLWEQPVPSFRGMNILTPVVFKDSIFTSTYQNKSFLYQTSLNEGVFGVKEAWTNPAQCYMSTPVVVDGRAYMHLQNRRFCCIDLASGERTWTSKPQDEYCSLVAQGDRILALGSGGRLLLLRANPVEFELIDEATVSDAETWAHLAVSGDELVVRELGALALHRWRRGSPATSSTGR